MEKIKAKWDVFAVLEEISYLDKSFGKTGDSELPDYKVDLWGPSYFLDEIRGNKEGNFFVRNYFVKEIEQITRYGLAYTKNINYFT